MRRDGWEDALNAVIARNSAVPFTWGKSDCLLFPLECVQAINGRDDLFELCRDYDSRLSAYRRLKSFGFNDVGDALAAHFPEIAPSFMSRGDLAIIRDGEVVSAAVCIGAQIIGRAENGLTVVSASLAHRAFRVD